MRQICVSFIVVGLLLLNGCATLEDLVQKPQIAFDSVGTRDMSLLAGTFVFRFNVTNPNPVGITLSDIVYDLDINGKSFVSSRMDQGLTLAASGTAPLEIPITLDYLELFDSLAGFLKSDAVSYRLTGSAGVGPFRIPYQRAGSIEMPKLPDITVDSIRMQQLSLSGARLQLVLGMKNPNAFGVAMDGLEYTARMGDTTLASGKTSQISRLAANGQSRVGIDLNLDFLKLGSGVRSLLSGSSAPLTLTGNMLVDSKIGTKKVPFSFDGKVPFAK